MLEKDVAGRSASTPIVLMAHCHCGRIYERGIGPAEPGRALGCLTALRLGDLCLNGHIHQIIQKVERQTSLS